MKYTQILLITIATILLACSPTDETLLIENINGYTIIGDELVEFKSVAIKNGKFIETSNVSLWDEFPNAKVIDGNGKTLLPGLIDAHGHVMGLGFQELNVNLMGINSLEATLDTLKNYAEANPDLEWIQGRGWNQTLWEENKFPTAADIDKVISDRPVWLSRVDGHAGWGNSMALRMAGISKDTPDPQGGKVIRDGSGNATGVFIDAAQGFVESEIPAPTEKEQRLALEKAYAQMAKMGITSVHDAGVGVKAWNLYKEFNDQDMAKTRIYGMISGSGNTFDELSKNGPIESYSDDMLALRSVKLYSDGALGSRGAAMLQPYSDDPGNVGLLFMEQEEMDAAVSKVVGKGFQANIHAIGDAGNRQVLDALEKAQDEHDDQGLRNRVEHAQIVALDDIPRFKELDLIASMQPTHATSDMNMAEDRVGPQRIKGGYAWKTFLEQGTVVAAGSDFPVEHSNPFFGLYSAVTRMDHSGNPDGGWYPNESLTREEALRAFTIDAAYAGHQEDVLGSIEEGKWADFILIDQDYFSVPASKIWEIKVLETWVAGKKVYSADK